MIFDEKKFHDFNDGHLSKPNPEFYHPASDEPQSEEPTVQNEAEKANDRVAEENIPIPVRPVNENRDEAVGETYEENFMEEVRNLNPQRQRRPPVRYDEELYTAEDLTADGNKPSNINEAWNGKNGTEWKKAAESEYKSLIDNRTWDRVPPPEDKNVIGSKWVFKVKRNAD
jgi:hypothetical protein